MRPAVKTGRYFCGALRPTRPRSIETAKYDDVAIIVDIAIFVRRLGKV
jgi:hypothetical protein